MPGADNGAGVANENELAGGGIEDADELSFDVADAGRAEGGEGTVGHERPEGESASAGGVGHGVPEIAGLPPLLPELVSVQIDGGHEVIGSVAGAAGENDRGA